MNLAPRGSTRCGDSQPPRQRKDKVRSARWESDRRRAAGMLLTYSTYFVLTEGDAGNRAGGQAKELGPGCTALLLKVCTYCYILTFVWIPSPKADCKYVVCLTPAAAGLISPPFVLVQFQRCSCRPIIRPSFCPPASDPIYTIIVKCCKYCTSTTGLANRVGDWPSHSCYYYYWPITNWYILT